MSIRIEVGKTYLIKTPYRSMVGELQSIEIDSNRPTLSLLFEIDDSAYWTASFDDIESLRDAGIYPIPTDSELLAKLKREKVTVNDNFFTDLIPKLSAISKAEIYSYIVNKGV